MIRIPAYFIVAVLLASPAAPQDKKQPPKKEPPPKLLYVVPLVAKPGEKQKLALRGKALDTVKEVKVTGADGARVRFLAAKQVPVPNNFPAERIGNSEVEIELELPKTTKPGTVTLTAGESEPYLLLVRDDLPAVAEKEDNGGFASAQSVPVPCAVEGTIKTERDVDVFRFEGKAGDAMRIEVQAARFGSPVDALVTVHDADRRGIAAADDTDKSADPVLTFALPRDGSYFVSAIDAHDLGGPNFGYRLIIQKVK